MFFLFFSSILSSAEQKRPLLPEKRGWSPSLKSLSFSFLLLRLNGRAS